MKRWLPVLAAGLMSWPAFAAADPPRAGLIHVRGAIGPATAGYIDRAIRRAAAGSMDVLVIELDTPGGLLESTKDIVQSLYASPVPTIVYVAPTGAT